MSFQTPTDSAIPARTAPPGAPAPRCLFADKQDSKETCPALELSPKRLRMEKDPSLHRQRIYEFLGKPFLGLLEYFDNALPLFFRLVVVFGNVNVDVGPNKFELWRSASEGHYHAWWDPPDNVFSCFMFYMIKEWCPIMRNCAACYRIHTEDYTDLEECNMRLHLRNEPLKVTYVRHAYDYDDRYQLTRPFNQQTYSFAKGDAEYHCTFDPTINVGGFFDSMGSWDTDSRHGMLFSMKVNWQWKPMEKEVQRKAADIIFSSFYEFLVPKIIQKSKESAIADPHGNEWWMVNGELMPPPRKELCTWDGLSHMFRANTIDLIMCPYFDPSKYPFEHVKPGDEAMEIPEEFADRESFPSDFLRATTTKSNIGLEIVRAFFLLQAFFRSNFRFVPSLKMVAEYYTFTSDFFTGLWHGFHELHQETVVFPRFPLALHVYIFATSAMPEQILPLQREIVRVYRGRIGIPMYEHDFIIELGAGLVWMMKSIESMMDDPFEYFHLKYTNEIVDGDFVCRWELDEYKHFIMTTVCMVNFVAFLRMYYRMVCQSTAVSGPVRYSTIYLNDFSEDLSEEFGELNNRLALIEILTTFLRIADKSEELNCVFPATFGVTRLGRARMTHGSRAVGTLYTLFRNFMKSDMAIEESRGVYRALDISLLEMLKNIDSNNQCLFQFSIPKGRHDMQAPAGKQYSHTNYHEHFHIINELFNKLYAKAFKEDWGKEVVGVNNN